ncbi:hypothetical protein J7T55_008271 [Diaporthe amygdali]|uniref:uncharacterized protein n=1 Tax=Phomopsis amygdali TaxID=1214568 RepID=UPI0022FECAE1|nr:uncharacterized protein J7T55_008271 [Diaporthe amygdali]KAJ0121109.1 hypothetical protein J7T55_008271 [Diaporthe amygdali]
MTQFSPTAMAEAVSNFLLTAREQEKHSGLAKRFDEEISSLRDTIADLQHRLAIQEGRPASDNSAAVKRHEEDIKGLQDTFDSEQCRYDKIAARISKIEADNTKLLEENTDIFAELRHIESLIMIAEAARAQHQGEHSRSLVSRQLATKQGELQRPPLRNLKPQDVYGQQLLPRQEAEEETGFSSPRGYSLDRAHQQVRSLEQPRLRGVKRSRIDDAAEPSRRNLPAQGLDNTLGSEKPHYPDTHQMERSGEINAYGEVPNRKEKKLTREQAPAEARVRAFADHYHSMRREFPEHRHKKDQRPFIWRFIDGVEDQELSRWLQECLKENLPKKVHQAKRPARRAGGRIVALNRDVTWEEVRDVLKTTPLPALTD